METKAAGTDQMCCYSGPSGPALTPSCLLAGCGSDPSPESKGVYVLFFLLSSFMLLLLLAAGVQYHRYHRGAFLVHCSSSSLPPPDLNNNLHRHHDDTNLPPPPPPARGPRGGWAQEKELPLLRFGPLVPPDGGKS